MTCNPKCTTHQVQRCKLTHSTCACSWTRSRSPSSGRAAAAPRSTDEQFLLPNVPWNDWEIREEDIAIDKRPDGSNWELGSGAFGKVRLQRRWVLRMQKPHADNSALGLAHCS